MKKRAEGQEWIASIYISNILTEKFEMQMLVGRGIDNPFTIIPFISRWTEAPILIGSGAWQPQVLKEDISIGAGRFLVGN